MERPASDTLSSLLDELVERRADETAVIDQRRSITYGALRDRAESLAVGLADLGVGAGDKVAILMENRVEWVEAMFAAFRLGATVVGVSTWAEPRELEYFVTHSGADAVVATSSFAGTDFATELDSLLGFGPDASGRIEEPSPAVVLLGSDRTGATAFDALAADGTLDDEDPNDADDTALLLYTSGSTSKPKGVPLLHGGVVENGYHIGERMRLSPDDRFWLASPLFWSYGSANALGAMLTHGASVVLQAPFDAEVAVDLIREHDCTVYYGMANMARGIAAVDGFDPEQTTLRTGTTIGPPEDVEFTIDELGVEDVCNVYGSTETYGNCAVTDATLPRSVRVHTQGRPLPGQEIVIRDPETDERLSQGEVGEIRVGGRITPGYHDNPEKNREAFDDEGYLKMGDLGQLDEVGRVQFRGRLKNMIKTGGINVSPKEIEEYLLEHPDVDQAYVVGLPDEEKDEVVGAVVVPELGASLSVEAIEEYSEGLAAYKRPASVVITDAGALPQTDTGKIRKASLDELFDQ